MKWATGTYILKGASTPYSQKLIPLVERRLLPVYGYY